MKKLIKLFEIILFLIFLVLVIFTKQKFTILLTIPVVILIYFFSKKVPIKRYSLFIFILAFVIRLISIFVLKVEITDDFKTMYEASKSLINGNLSFMNNFYFHTYIVQLGLTLYQALLLKLVNSVIILKIFNSIYTSLIVVMIYKIVKELFEENTARMVSLGYIFYLYPLYLNSVLTNQHIPALLMLIVIYIILKKEQTIKTSIIIALLLAVANFFRTESIIFIMGIFAYNIINLTKTNYKKTLINLGLVLVTYFSITTLSTQILLHTPLFTKTDNDPSYKKDVTLWKFYCGLNKEYNGLYNEEDANTYFQSDNSKELLKERIKNDYKSFPVLFIKKEVILWTQTNYDLCIKNNINSNLYNLLLYFNQGILNLVLVLFVISLYPFRKLKEDKTLFIKILIGLYVLIYAFIEISPRYAYILHILIFLIIGRAIEDIYKLINKKGETKNEKVIKHRKKVH